MAKAVKPIRLPAITIVPITVADAKPIFLHYMETKGKAESSLRSMDKAFRRLIEAAGPNTKLHEVNASHITTVMADVPGQGIRNNTISVLRGIWKWGALYRHMTPNEFEWPITAWSRQNYEKEQPPYVPAKEFPALLDTSDQFHPVYRAACALGLYLLARGPSELGVLRLWDLDLHNWKVSITRSKTKQAADMINICGELRVELIRWLRFYEAWSQKNLGCGLKREWYLLPKSNYSRSGVEHYKLYPEEPKADNTISNMGTKILEAYGSPARGSHAFRKFGGRALYDELKLSGHGRDIALDIVRSMYGHKSRTMTETYLNLKLDREDRNKAIIANDGFMFGFNNPNKERATELTTKQLPASLVGGVLLGGTSQKALDEADAWVRKLPVFRAA